MSRVFSVPLTVAFFLAVVPDVLLAQPFEGAVTMRMTGKGAGSVQQQEIEYLVRNGKVRVSTGGPGGAMALISVPQEQKVYVLLAAQNTYMEMPIAEAASSVAAKTPADAKITRTGRMETVAGYTCEHVTVASASQTVDICMAKGLGGYVNPLASMQRGSEPAWQKMLTADGGFPLKVTMPDGSVPIEVIKIEKKKLAIDVFSVPLNYTKMEMPRRR
ncbi:DUF4412 domain-containing protein [Gemmatimonas groenlandica]|uniref:DUF4412 domain-containing protein n=1 Tax=Gemmatimonas groenlandica TaxID=2732249 RepID=A0A6M4ILX6_9BACT|nr:DUF4412 domain-containing protein [Gemmatimonas groenlandica]QJR34012.1 DUF4412 domain-containing protein [Gemmatimonas groenlandica]